MRRLTSERVCASVRWFAARAENEGSEQQCAERHERFSVVDLVVGWHAPGLFSGAAHGADAYRAVLTCKSVDELAGAEQRDQDRIGDHGASAAEGGDERDRQADRKEAREGHADVVRQRMRGRECPEVAGVVVGESERGVRPATIHVAVNRIAPAKPLTASPVAPRKLSLTPACGYTVGY